MKLAMTIWAGSHRIVLSIGAARSKGPHVMNFKERTCIKVLKRRGSLAHLTESVGPQENLSDHPWFTDKAASGDRNLWDLV